MIINRKSYEKNKLKNQEYARKYKLKHKKDIRAQYLALRNVPIPKNKLCEECNKNLAIERHHEDYNKPLEVKFLCKRCHINGRNLKWNT